MGEAKLRKERGEYPQQTPGYRSKRTGEKGRRYFKPLRVGEHVVLPRAGGGQIVYRSKQGTFVKEQDPSMTVKVAARAHQLFGAKRPTQPTQRKMQVPTCETCERPFIPGAPHVCLK